MGPAGQPVARPGSKAPVCGGRAGGVERGPRSARGTAAQVTLDFGLRPRRLSGRSPRAGQRVHPQSSPRWRGSLPATVSNHYVFEAGSPAGHTIRAGRSSVVHKRLPFKMVVLHAPDRFDNTQAHFGPSRFYPRPRPHFNRPPKGAHTHNERPSAEEEGRGNVRETRSARVEVALRDRGF